MTTSPPLDFQWDLPADLDFDLDWLQNCGEFLDFLEPAAQHITTDSPSDFDAIIRSLSSVPVPPAPAATPMSPIPAASTQPRPKEYKPRVLTDESMLKRYEERSWILQRTEAERQLADSRNAIQFVPCNNKRGLDARWPEQLLQMDIKELNAYLRTHSATMGLSPAEIKELKAARRRAKSRAYSLTNRIKRQANKNTDISNVSTPSLDDELLF